MYVIRLFKLSQQVDNLMKHFFHLLKLVKIMSGYSKRGKNRRIDWKHRQGKGGKRRRRDRKRPSLRPKEEEEEYFRSRNWNKRGKREGETILIALTSLFLSISFSVFPIGRRRRCHGIGASKTESR